MVVGIDLGAFFIDNRPASGRSESYVDDLRRSGNRAVYRVIVYLNLSAGAEEAVPSEYILTRGVVLLDRRVCTRFIIDSRLLITLVY